MANGPTAELAPPLADYFFIAGIESTQIFDEKLYPNGLPMSPSPAPVDTTIEENEVLETDINPRPKSAEGIDSASTKRRSRLSYEARKSISSLLGSESKTASNRSSATIKGIQGEGTTSGLSEIDFDNALRKFASERENFLEEIHFSAGTIPQMSKPKRAKTQRIVNEDPSAIKSGVGSIRRRLSTMNSLKRQPSLIRQGMNMSAGHTDDGMLIAACSLRSNLETPQWL
jgi:hypothetical protein